MADFNTFVQTELPKRPFVSTDGAAGDVLVRSSNPLAVRELTWVSSASLAPPLEPATTTTLGGVKQGTNILIAADGTISVVGIAGAGYDPFMNQPTNTTYAYNGDGTVASVDETINSQHVITTYAYNPDGTVATVVTTFGGQTRTETFNYNGDGTVASITAVVA